jgi:cytochrome c551/c552
MAHFKVKVKDSKRKYRKVTEAYTDAADKTEAIHRIKKNARIKPYFEDPRYQIIMTENPTILQDA